MRRTDVHALLCTLMPALALGLGGCTAKSSADEGAVTTPDPDADPTVLDTGKPEPEPEAKVDLPPASEKLPEAVPERMPEPKRPRATCPTINWCAPVTAAVKVAADENRTAEGCPTEVTSERGLPVKIGGDEQKAANLMDDPVYSALFLRSRVGPVGINAGETQARRDAGSTDACCYSWTRPCPGGRAFLDTEQQPVLAVSRPGQGWSEGNFELHASPAALNEAAQQWLADAAMEHASVASFSRVALELMALGAPADLVAGSHRAALDEIQHAQTCMAIARACGADNLEPGPMAVTGPRAPELGRFSADTFIEGCVGETIAALAVSRAATRCGSPGLRGALERIAADEADHAALAWRSVGWALRQDPRGVRAALKQRALAFRETVEAASRGLGSAQDQELAALGRLSAPELDAARADAWFGIVEPMLAELGVHV